MSGSVWYEQIDTALVGLLSSTITVKNENNELIMVDARVRNPDEELQGTYPCITVASYDEKFSYLRDGRDRFVSSTNVETNEITLEYPSKPYDLYYQIDLWSDYQVDINTMSMQLLNLIGEHYCLEVKDTLLNDRVSVMDKVAYAIADYIEDETNKRVFHRVYSYKIQVELDEKPPEVLKYASSVDLQL